MDYKGWVLSIYDEYVRRSNNNDSSNRKYIVSNSKRRTQMLNNMAQKEKASCKVVFNRKNKIFNRDSILIGIFLIICCIVALVLLILAAINKISAIWVTMFIVLCCGILLIIILSSIYKNEPTIKQYHESAEILRDILKEEDIYNKEFMIGLKNYTGSIFSKIKFSKISAIISYFVGIGFFAYVKNVSNLISAEGFRYIVLFILFVIPLVCLVFIVSISIPNNRIIRKQVFHQLLKVLIAYDFESKAIVEHKEIISNEDKDTKEKDIV